MSHRKRLQRVFPDLKAWRIANGLSQRKAAQMLGMSQSRYCRLECRKLTATGDSARHIMSVANVPLETIVGLA